MRSALPLLAALLVPAATSAQPSLGLRLAYAPALGSAATDVPASEVMRAQVPLQVDALWRFGAGAGAAGLYASYALGVVGSEACRGGDCSGSGLRLGAQAELRLPPFPSGLAPWLGAALGWERATLRRERLGSEVTWRWSGLEGALQAGLTWPLRPGLAIGPFLQLSLGRYGRLAVDTPEASASSSVAEKALHAWLHAGVRGSLEL
jgi:hypothetical protein